MRPDTKHGRQRPVRSVSETQTEREVGCQVAGAERQPPQDIEHETVGGQHGEDQEHQPVHGEPSKEGIQRGDRRGPRSCGRGNHVNSAPWNSAEYSALPLERTLSHENRKRDSSSTAGTTNRAVARASASRAVFALAHVATTVVTGLPVVPSRTWCSPSPQARRFEAEAHSAPAPRGTVPIARLASYGCSSATVTGACPPFRRSPLASMKKSVTPWPRSTS